MSYGTTTETRRVWIGCLACYNAGRLVGEWVDAVDAGDTTDQDVHRDMLDRGAALLHNVDGAAWVVVPGDGPSPHEELWCMDHEGFGDLLTGECSPAQAQELAEVLAELGDTERDAFASWYEGTGTPDSDSIDQFRDAFHGTWESEADFAANFADDMGAFHVDNGPHSFGDPVDVSDRWPFDSIDWKQAWRNLEGFYSQPAPGGDVWIFQYV